MNTRGMKSGNGVRAWTLAGTSIVWAGLASAIPTRPDDVQCECAAGKAGAPVDPATGRDTRNWPLGPGVDFVHMGLDLTILDMNTPRFSGVQTLAVRAINKPTSSVTLDARLLSISGVTVAGRRASFRHDGQRLTIDCNPPLSPGVSTAIVTTYEVNDTPRGLFWTPESPDWPGRPAQIHTQGQPETNSYWFPCHDFPNERMTSELSVTVPQGFTVCSNGWLAEQTRRVLERPDGIGGTTLEAYDKFRWVQDKSHVSYLVTMVVGKFDVVDVGTPKLPMPVYAPLGRGHDVRATFGRTANMVSLFERLTGQFYPWDKYAQLVVWNFGSGGMENTSATSLYDTAILDARSLLDHDLDGLISHELAHQWFGDLITCNTWEHIWLNEGWATYASHLWFEQRDGRAAYEAGVRDNFDAIIANDTGSLPQTPAMASKTYADPWEPFRRQANPYSKGASVLHMLRTRLGDKPFFEGVRLYFDRHRLRTVETNDFRKALEDVSGVNLELFFAQWVQRPNIPRVKVSAAWDPVAGALQISATQTQTINPDNPAFEFRLPVWAHTPGSSGWSTTTLFFDGRDSTASLALDGEPDAIAFDPELTVLAEVKCQHPAASSVVLATDGPTLNARLQGLRGLKTAKPGDAGQIAVAGIVRDLEAPIPVRRAAVDVLAACGTRDLFTLSTENIKAWQIREAIVKSLAELATLKAGATDITRQRTYSYLDKLYKREPSVKVQQAILRGFAAMNAGAAMPLIVEAAHTDSQDDALRQAALDAVVTLDRREGLLLAVELTKPGQLSRTRPAAVGAVVKLARHDMALAINVVGSMIDDREQRSRQAAGQGLVDLGDPRGLEILAKRAKVARDPYEQNQAKQWFDALTAKLKPAPK
ncbi:MAG: M1 family aminopeptidase [Planctomycetota bacterium]